jgi:ubiquitin C-terminal hydrolase
MIQALFGIDLQWHKKCSRCEEISLTGQTELMLHLNIGTRFYTQGKLESYIRRAMNDTVHDYKCENPNCIERRDKTVDFLAKKRKCYIIGAPDVLLISIQRFGLTGRKIMDTVVYPCILDLRPFMEPGAGSGSYQYELRAVLNHIGHHVDSGHYTTTARSEAKDTRGKARWFEANDSRVRSNPFPCHISES